MRLYKHEQISMLRRSLSSILPGLLIVLFGCEEQKPEPVIPFHPDYVSLEITGSTLTVDSIGYLIGGYAINSDIKIKNLTSHRFYFHFLSLNNCNSRFMAISPILDTFPTRTTGSGDSILLNAYDSVSRLLNDRNIRIEETRHDSLVSKYRRELAGRRWIYLMKDDIPCYERYSVENTPYLEIKKAANYEIDVSHRTTMSVVLTRINFLDTANRLILDRTISTHYMNANRY